MVSQNPRRQPADTEINEEMIRTLVHAFYRKIHADSILGPIFAGVVGSSWDSHLAKMCDFWSSVMLMSGRYRGNPIIAHLRLKMVRPEHFERWFNLFRETALEVCPPDIAGLFCAKAGNIGRSLQLGMFYRPAAASAGGVSPRGAP